MSARAEQGYFEEVAAGSLAFRHGTLLLASAYHALWRGVPVPSSCHIHSALAIRYVKSSLETAEGQIADGTLAAIACLAAFEVILPVTKIPFASTYFDGLTLNRMLSMLPQIHRFISPEWRH